MGLMNKIKGSIFEEDPNTVIVEVPGSIPQELLNVQVSNISVSVDTTNVLEIDGIYANAALADKEKSIYKVEEIKNTLGTLPKDAMKAATLGMMGVVKLTAEEVQADATNRTEILLESLTQYSAETAKIKSEAETEIADLEARIDEAKKRIATRELEQEKSQETITAELDRIKVTADFIA